MFRRQWSWQTLQNSGFGIPEFRSFGFLGFGVVRLKVSEFPTSDLRSSKFRSSKFPEFQISEFQISEFQISEFQISEFQVSEFGTPSFGIPQVRISNFPTQELDCSRSSGVGSSVTKIVVSEFLSSGVLTFLASEFRVQDFRSS